MNEIFEIVKTNPLFLGIDEKEFSAMLDCVQGRRISYQKGDVILLAGSPVETMGLVLSGTIQVLREDGEGRQNLMAELAAGEIFGEVFACAGITRSPVTVLCSADGEVLHLNYRKVITTCSGACVFHQRLIENMLALLAKKNLLLNQKIELLSRRTTRERLLLFFDLCRGDETHFTLPYSRDELAAFLCVERSAMSAELSRMQRDGLIRYHRQEVELLEPEP